MKNILKQCNLCPRNCLVNRYQKTGYCKQTNKIKVAKCCLTYYEEPCISNQKGSGTIFFSGCNLGCIYCQNIKISKYNYGKTISNKKLAEIMLSLQAKGAININLVTPTSHIIGIVKALKIAKKNGLKIPVIYNCSGYENVNSLKLLKNLIDIYLPDFKYYDNKYALKYSNIPNYTEIVKSSLKEMYEQVGPCQFDKNNNLQKGLLVRHLMLPGLKKDTKKILNYLITTYQDNIYLSLMNQYTIMENLPYQELKKNLKEKDYEEIIEYALKLNITNCYCQLKKTNSKIYIPDFNLEGIINDLI